MTREWAQLWREENVEEKVRASVDEAAAVFYNNIPLLTSNVRCQNDSPSFSTFCRSTLSPKKTVLAPVSLLIFIWIEPLILTNYKMRTLDECSGEGQRMVAIALI